MTKCVRSSRRCCYTYNCNYTKCFLFYDVRGPSFSRPTKHWSCDVENRPIFPREILSSDKLLD